MLYEGFALGFGVLLGFLACAVIVITVFCIGYILVIWFIDFVKTAIQFYGSFFGD